MILKLNFCLTTFSVLILLSFSTQAFAANQAKTKTSSPSSTVLSKSLKNSTSEQVEGSANIPGRLADIEVNGSGYPTDDEDGDDVHGSGKPPSQAVVPSTTTKSDVKHTSPSNVVVTAKPATIPTTTASFKPPVQPKPKPADNDKEIKVEDDEDDDEDEDEDDDEDDEDFADENVHNDDDFFTTSTTTHRPTMTNGFYAAIAGGVLVAVITAILLVLFVVFRIRKKDEGSYALDEPKQARPYATYAYTKASTKEFYA
uniref:Syndecan n=1 Tax=Caenorhabditis tropicalis TaxID=1561998 RepID=A0A1I7U114_9PELO